MFKCTLSRGCYHKKPGKYLARNEHLGSCLQGMLDFFYSLEDARLSVHKEAVIYRILWNG